MPVMLLENLSAIDKIMIWFSGLPDWVLAVIFIVGVVTIITAVIKKLIKLAVIAVIITFILTSTGIISRYAVEEQIQNAVDYISDTVGSQNK